MEKLKQLSEPELQAFREDLNMKEPYIEKLEYAATAISLENLNKKNERAFGTNTYEINVAPTSDEEAQIYAEWLVEKVKLNIYDAIINSLNIRLGAKSTPKKIELLKVEKEKDWPGYKNFDFTSGYNAEKTGYKIKYPYITEPSLMNTLPNLWKYAEGSACAMYEEEVQDRLAELTYTDNEEKPEVVPSPPNDSEIPFFGPVSQQILALYELGFFKDLATNYPSLENRIELTRLVVSLLKLDGKENWEAAYRAIGRIYVRFGDDKSLQTRKAISDLSREFSKVGITKFKNIINKEDLPPKEKM